MVPPVTNDASQAAKADDRRNAPPEKTVPLINNIYVSEKREIRTESNNPHPYPEPNEWTDPLTIFTGLLAFITFGLVYVGWIQHRITRSLERARLIIVFDQPFQPKAGIINEISFTIKNVGRTEALLKGIDIDAIRWNGNLPKREPKPKPTGTIPTYAIIPASQSILIRDRSLANITFTQEDVENVLSDQLFFDVYGYIVYDDIFGCRHMTRFCQVFNRTLNNEQGGFELPNEPKESYNDAD